jgi:hypothetical protein
MAGRRVVGRRASRSLGDVRGSCLRALPMTRVALSMLRGQPYRETVRAGDDVGISGGRVAHPELGGGPPLAAVRRWAAGAGAGPAQQPVGLAKAICVSCAAVLLCRSLAVRTGQVFGVWGGLSEQELRFLNHTSAPTEHRGNACASGFMSTPSRGVGKPGHASSAPVEDETCSSRAAIGRRPWSGTTARAAPAATRFERRERAGR